MASFESKRFFWYLVKVFFASNFINSSWISIKIGTNSQQIRLELLKKYFCVKQHGFDMVHFMAKSVYSKPHKHFYFQHLFFKILFT